ncbi:MAG: flagellar basal body rod protein FlgB [Armatimonadetes bacterium]|nr:flagellar basal body rod protein FlgB [Armatimonadota bacterium]
MDWNLLSDISSGALTGALRGCSARQRALADNIANVDTPGFIRQDLQFEEALATAVRTARRAPQRAGHVVSEFRVEPKRDRSLPARADGNNVDIDREMVMLARNALRYQAAGEALSARVRMLRSAIQGGRR